jgi:hypothetical protein
MADPKEQFAHRTDLENQNDGNPPLFVSARFITIILTPIMVFLILMDLVRLYFKNTKPELGSLNEVLDRLFKLTGEFNFPTLFSAFILLFAGILLLVVYSSQKQRPFRLHWLFLGLIFVFLSLDESLMIHESLSRFIRQNIDVQGSIRYGTWSIPYLIITFLIGLLYLKFVLHLPKLTKLLFILAGFIYVMGAGGLEILEGYFFFKFGVDSLLYRFSHWVQEILEMVGIIIFIYAILDYLAVTRTTLIIKQ